MGKPAPTYLATYYLADTGEGFSLPRLMNSQARSRLKREHFGMMLQPLDRIGAATRYYMYRPGNPIGVDNWQFYRRLKEIREGGKS